MSDKKKDITALFIDGKEIDKALKKGVREALLQHKRAGCPIVIWQDGKNVWIPPEDIVIEED